MAKEILMTKLLFNALQRGDKTTCLDLLGVGADPNRLTQEGVAPFHLAVGHEDECLSHELTEAILTMGGDANVRTFDGTTPLHIAATIDRCGIVDTLLLHGADPTIEDPEDNTALDCARASGCIMCVERLKQQHQPQTRYLGVGTNTSSSELAKSPRVNDVKATFKRRYTAAIQTQLELYNPGLHQFDVTSPDHPLVVPRLQGDVTLPLSPPYTPHSPTPGLDHTLYYHPASSIQFSPDSIELDTNTCDRGFFQQIDEETNSLSPDQPQSLLNRSFEVVSQNEDSDNKESIFHLPEYGNSNQKSHAQEQSVGYRTKYDHNHSVLDKPGSPVAKWLEDNAKISFNNCKSQHGQTSISRRNVDIDSHNPRQIVCKQQNTRTPEVVIRNASSPARIHQARPREVPTARKHRYDVPLSERNSPALQSPASTPRTGRRRYDRSPSQWTSYSSETPKSSHHRSYESPQQAKLASQTKTPERDRTEHNTQTIPNLEELNGPAFQSSNSVHWAKDSEKAIEPCEQINVIKLDSSSSCTDSFATASEGNHSILKSQHKVEKPLRKVKSPIVQRARNLHQREKASIESDVTKTSSDFARDLSFGDMSEMSILQSFEMSGHLSMFAVENNSAVMRQEENRQLEEEYRRMEQQVALENAVKEKKRALLQKIRDERNRPPPPPLEVSDSSPEYTDLCHRMLSTILEEESKDLTRSRRLSRASGVLAKIQESSYCDEANKENREIDQCKDVGMDSLEGSVSMGSSMYSDDTDTSKTKGKSVQPSKPANNPPAVRSQTPKIVNASMSMDSDLFTDDESTFESKKSVERFLPKRDVPLTPTSQRQLQAMKDHYNSKADSGIDTASNTSGNRKMKFRTPGSLRDAHSSFNSVRSVDSVRSFDSVQSIQSVKSLDSVKSHRSVDSVKSTQSAKSVGSVKSVQSVSSVGSGRSKGSVCSCASAASVQTTVFTDQEAGVSLVEVHYPPEPGRHDPNCTILSAYLLDTDVENTPVKDAGPRTPVSQHRNPLTQCNRQPPVKALFSDGDESSVSGRNVSIQASIHSDTTIDSNNTTVREVVSVPADIAAMTDDELRCELIKLGDVPGPVLKVTRRMYEERLTRLRQDPQLLTLNQNTQPEFGRELILALRGQLDVSALADLETSMTAAFLNPDPSKHWREGTSKTSFIYLLLDPTITANLPVRVKALGEDDAYKTFLRAIFYVGKGKRSRPYMHFKEATKALKANNVKVSKKVQQIHEIWGAGQGVVSLHIFQNVIPAEAFTREAVIIDALGLGRLTNVKGGEYYGSAASWSGPKRRKLGVHLLRKAFRIFINEGERQIKAQDLKL